MGEAEAQKASLCMLKRRSIFPKVSKNDVAAGGDEVTFDGKSDEEYVATIGVIQVRATFSSMEKVVVCVQTFHRWRNSPRAGSPLAMQRASSN